MGGGVPQGPRDKAPMAFRLQRLIYKTTAAHAWAACGDVAVVRKGASLICETCGARAARLGEDQGA